MLYALVVEKEVRFYLQLMQQLGFAKTNVKNIFRFICHVYFEKANLIQDLSSNPHLILSR